ncbi:M15 family metallopeptidase [Undibacterium umbellatum]|uniref:D-alanyl-D-alanine carboxypeptidase family protein n=1 Tax=Undibacterium umbellatum TaxID=2762300 RepID=A0ABR6Z6H9_9BURK|nr:M15 family metallopeptidase [Undibacterium umbellatum]MBC3907214.1 D-alanyl-D-alanine carboxypeptidase family protein [Undibacterium umbellatum]
MSMAGATPPILIIPPQLLEQRNLLIQQEASELVLAETGEDGWQYLLTPEANLAWQAMKQAANQDGIALLMISAFRSIARQTEIISNKLAEGKTLEDILLVCAPPGYSEHHTGRAIDIATPEDPELEISFDTTTAFAWLQNNAKRFGFYMSYPHGNSSGFQYEPWHWCFQPE